MGWSKRTFHGIIKRCQLVLFYFCVAGLGWLQLKAKCVCRSVVGPNTSINAFAVGHRFKEKTDVYVVAQVVSRFIILQSDISNFVTY